MRRYLDRPVGKGARCATSEGILSHSCIITRASDSLPLRKAIASVSVLRHATIELRLDSVWVQILVGATGVPLMTTSAYYWTWSRQRGRMLLMLDQET